MKRKLLIAIFALLLAGCASRGTKVSTDNLVSENDPKWQSHYQHLLTVERWEAKGKVAASQAGEGGNASFVWENNGDLYKVRMFGPFGAGSAELTGSKSKVILAQADGSTNVASTPEELLYQQTGLNLPVRGLAYWIKGVPVPNTPSKVMHINSHGQLVFLMQGNWRITYSRYLEVEGHQMPTKLELARDDMKVKIIVKSWDF